MDQTATFTAAELINTWNEQELSMILKKYGEERFSRRIARRIVEERDKMPIESTHRLAEIIKQSIPAAARRSGPHPARRSFQAIRIAVNDELEAFQDALHQSVECLEDGGRLCVISFHSLEDRICKQTMNSYIKKCICPPGLPICACDQKSLIRWITKKPIVAGKHELDENPRARSAKLRIAEKTKQT